MRTVIVYHDDGSKSVLTGQAAKRASLRGKGKGEEQSEKVDFHRGVLDTFREAEANGDLGHMSRREADFHKTVHTTAAECGGDLPPVGATRINF